MEPDITRRVAPAGPYFYRRPLHANEVIPAIGVGIGVGLAAFYVARLLLQRTPLAPAPEPPLAREDLLSPPTRRDAAARG